MLQQTLFEQDADASRVGSFADNLKLPVHRWFRYSAGFSGSWAETLIAEEARQRPVRVLDPFAGSATTLVAAEQCGVPAYGLDPHPFVARVARAKLAYRSSVEAFDRQARITLQAARACAGSDYTDSFPPIIRQCYEGPALRQLDGLRRAIVYNSPRSEATQLLWLALASILRPTSHVGTANCQYLLPRRRKAHVAAPFRAFSDMVQTMREDMNLLSAANGPRAQFEQADARTGGAAPEGFNLVVTSPPYPNNFDYADATRLELAFFQEISRYKDLQNHTRRHLMRSCTQHVPNSAVDWREVVDDALLEPIRPELRTVCERLAEVRMTKGGRKTYHNMVACYFLDLAQVWRTLRRLCDTPCKVCFVIGDSAPYGVYVPVIEWLSALALAAGFKTAHFDKTRERNTKWKNRKHRVPLCEGHLWVTG